VIYFLKLKIFKGKNCPRKFAPLVNGIYLFQSSVKGETGKGNTNEGFAKLVHKPLEQVLLALLLIPI